MRVTAAELARATHVLLVGVGEYALPGPPPLAAAHDVERLRAALIDPAACGIPGDQVRALVNHEASKQHVLDAMRQFGAAADERATVVIYFSGHGHRSGEDFFFHLFDSDPKALAATALSAAELTSCLVGCRARGVFVIVDCCVGAGFAETAQRFFFDLGSRDFRIALAASRATEPSWEAPGQGGSLFTMHLVRVLTGETSAGTQPGEITYLGLVEALSFAINEDLSLVRPDHPRQELVANGSTVSDPLLFVCARAAMDGLTVQTGRVSREQMRRVLRRSAIGLIAGLLTTMGIYCAWMASYEHAIADGGGTTIWRGHPSMSGFGYPDSELRLTYRLSDYAPNTVLGSKHPLIAPSGSGGVLKGIGESLSVPIRARRLANAGNRDAAYRLLVDTLSRPTDALTDVQAFEAQNLRIRLAPLKWLPRLQRTVREESTQRRHAALLALLDVAPSDGLKFLINAPDHPEQLFDHQLALKALAPPCTADKLQYLRALITRPTFPERAMLTWWRLGCAAETEDIGKLVEHSLIDEVETVGTWARLVGFRRPEEVLKLPNLGSTGRAGFALGYGMPCPLNQETTIPLLPEARVQFLRHVIRACKGSRLSAKAVPTGLQLTLLLDGVRVPSTMVHLPAPVASLGSAVLHPVRPTLRLLQEAKVQGADSYLVEQALRGHITLVAPAAVHAARRLGVPWRPGQGLTRGGNSGQYAIAYYLWMHASDPQTADRQMLRNLEDPNGLAIDGYFGLAGMSAEDLRVLRSMIAAPLDQRSEAAAQLVAMYGGDEDLTRILESSEPRIRNALYTHGAFNRRFRPWLTHQQNQWPVFDPNDLHPTMAYLARLERELKSLKPSDACWLLQLERSGNDMAGELGYQENLRRGSRIKLEQLLEQCAWLP